MEHIETSQWSELSDDLLHEIAKLLYSYDDYCRFRAVSKEWNRVLPQIPNRPWLVLPFDDKAIETRVAEEKIYYVKLPELQTTKLRGSCFGWLMVVGFDGTLRMLNPFNRKHNDLPPMSTFPDIIDYNPDREMPYVVKNIKVLNEDDNNPYNEDDDHHDEDSDDNGEDDGDSYDEGDDPNESDDDSDESDDESDDDSDESDDEGDDDSNEGDDEGDDVYISIGSTYGTVNISNKFMQMMHVKKIIISSPPDDEYKHDEFMAIAIYGIYNRLAFCKHGDNKWTDIPKSQKDDVNCDYDYEDVIFHQGKIYVIDTFTRIFEFDIKTLGTPLGRIIEIPKPHDLYFPASNWKFAYLIGCIDGSLLMVVRHINFDDEDIGFNSTKFDIYKLENGAKQWSRIFDLKKYALFIGFNSSVLMSANIFPNGWENRVHYTDNVLPTQFYKSIGGYDIGVFNLEDEKFTLLFPDMILLPSPPIWLV